MNIYCIGSLGCQCRELYRLEAVHWAMSNHFEKHWYFRLEGILLSQRPSHISYLWRSLESTQDINLRRHNFLSITNTLSAGQLQTFIC